jgi:hypothetical protein
MLGYEHANGERGITRFAVDDLGHAAQVGRDVLAAHEQRTQRGVLVVDGYVHLNVGKVDALIVEAVEYGPTKRSLTMDRPQPAAFFAGVDAHEPAAAVWNAHLDESL